MRLSERIYRKLLKAYPERYRRQYEEAMAQLFADQLRAADTGRKLAALWLRTLGDFLRTVPARHAETPNSHYGLKDALRVPSAPWNSSARRAVFLSCVEANSFGRRAITTEDLLMGILREDPQVQELAGSAEAVEGMRREMESREAAPRRIRLATDLPLDAFCRSAVALAKEEAPRRGAPEATARHLLIGIVQQEQTLAAQLLRRHGIDLERLRSDA
ncbi:MAG: hypothetical protein LAP40_08570 [Acidobacteriia bacterium]|nr:hypothetical protein [Terriglobia bacterium]